MKNPLNRVPFALISNNTHCRFKKRQCCVFRDLQIRCIYVNLRIYAKGSSCLAFAILERSMVHGPDCVEKDNKEPLRRKVCRHHKCALRRRMLSTRMQVRTSSKQARFHRRRRRRRWTTCVRREPSPCATRRWWRWAPPRGAPHPPCCLRTYIPPPLLT